MYSAIPEEKAQALQRDRVEKKCYFPGTLQVVLVVPVCDRAE